VNLREALDEVFDMATEMTGCHDPEIVDAERAWIAVVKQRTLAAIDLRKQRDPIARKPT
jgi:hypothetical protein